MGGVVVDPRRRHRCRREPEEETVQYVPTQGSRSSRKSAGHLSLPGVVNTVKAVALLSFLAGVLVVAGTLLAGRSGLIVGLVLGLALVAGTWWFSARVAIRAAGARPLSPTEAPELTAMVAELADAAGIPRPSLYLSPSPQPNAFATGRNPSHAVVAVTQGLIELVPPDEIRGVLAHELGHVRNRDILLTSIAAALATGLSVIANMATFGMLFGGRDQEEEGPGLVATLALLLIAPLAGTLLQLALSRSREFEADRTGAELLGGNGEPLAGALIRIDAHAHAQPMEIAPSQAQAWIVNPLAGADTMTRLFSTHPPLRERVERLRRRR
jgi:heat shock protein HtpX